MPTITATADVPNSLVRLDVDFSDVGCPYAYITRVNEATGVSTALRLPYPTAVVNGQTVLNMWAGFKGVVFDAEFPADTPIHYVAAFSGTPTLNVNSTFESGIPPWTPFGGAAVLTRTDITPTGTGAGMQIAFDGVTASLGAQTEYVPAVVGVTYTATATMRVAVTSGLRGVRLSWYTAALGLISSSTNGPTVTTAWQTVTQSAAAPATTAYVRMDVLAPGSTPGTTNYLYADNATLTSTFAVSASTASLTVPSLGRFWLKDPLRPARNLLVLDSHFTDPECQPERMIVYVGNVGQQRPAFAAGFDVNNLPDQIVTARQRGGLAGNLYLATRTYADRQALDLLTTPGTPLLWQVPPGWNQESAYLNVGTLGWDQLHPDERVQPRRATLPYRVAVAPVGPASAPLGYRWADSCFPYANWAAANSAGVTWLQANDGGV